jgi:hypothetical protein
MDYTPLFNDGNLTPNFLQFKLDVPTNTTPTLSSVGIENNLFHFTVNGVSGVRYTVQSSDNLTNWTSVATNSGAPFIFVEPRDQSITNRFYRTLIESEAVKVN